MKEHVETPHSPIDFPRFDPRAEGIPPKIEHTDYLAQLLADFDLIDADSPLVPGVDLVAMIRSGPFLKLEGRTAEEHKKFSALPDQAILEAVNKHLRGQDFGAIKDPERLTGDGFIELRELAEILISTGREVRKSDTTLEISALDTQSAVRFAIAVGLDSEDKEIITNLSAFNASLRENYGKPPPFLFDDTFNIAFAPEEEAVPHANYLGFASIVFQSLDEISPELEGFGVVQLMRAFAERLPGHPLADVIKNLPDGDAIKLLNGVVQEKIGVDISKLTADGKITRDEFPVLLANVGKKMSEGTINGVEVKVTDLDLEFANFFLDKSGLVPGQIGKTREEMVKDLAAFNAGTSKLMNHVDLAGLIAELIDRQKNEMPQPNLEGPKVLKPQTI